MLVIVSPAKKLNLTHESTSGHAATKPRFGPQAKTLAKLGAELSEGDLQKMMHISAKLSEQAANWFATFSDRAGASDAKAAAYMFSGDTYVGLDIRTLSDKAVARAQDHLLIISGMYGLLSPLDAIRPYRMDMGTRLANPRGKNLYEHWQADVTKAVNAQAKKIKAKAVINLASKEYFKVIEQGALDVPVITPVFKEIQDGDIRTLGLFAKRARGAMARWIIENKITKPEDIKAFNIGGYTFQPGASGEFEWTFARPQPAKVTGPKARTKKPRLEKRSRAHA